MSVWPDHFFYSTPVTAPFIKGNVNAYLLARVSETPAGCWEWQRGLFSNGYGQAHHKAMPGVSRAHRMSYITFVGPIPDGMQVCHRCDNRRCINPQHLFLGTASDNMQDASQKGRLSAGDFHWARTQPHKLRRGADHYAKQHPDSRQGERNGRAKLVADDVLRIRDLHANGVPAAKLARMFGVTPANISDIARHKIWRHLQRQESKETA